MWPILSILVLQCRSISGCSQAENTEANTEAKINMHMTDRGGVLRANATT